MQMLVFWSLKGINNYDRHLVYYDMKMQSEFSERLKVGI